VCCSVWFPVYNKLVQNRKSSVSLIRLQWDPDHSPKGGKIPLRRALQVGLKGVTTFIDGTDIIKIVDMTRHFHAQRLALKKNNNNDDVQVPCETLYLCKPTIASIIGLSEIPDNRSGDAEDNDEEDNDEEDNGGEDNDAEDNDAEDNDEEDNDRDNASL